MIAPNFYRRENLEASYLTKKVLHFPIRRRPRILGRYRYTIKEGEDLLLLSQRVFGLGFSYFWTILAEMNPTKMPDDWTAGEIVLLPKTVITTSQQKVDTFANAKITSTTV